MHCPWVGVKSKNEECHGVELLALPARWGRDLTFQMDRLRRNTPSPISPTASSTSTSRTISRSQSHPRCRQVNNFPFKALAAFSV